MNQRPHPALLGGLVGVMVASWALNFLAGKLGLRHLSPLTLASFRVVLAGLLMLPVYLVFGPRGRKAAFPGARKSVRERGNFWTFALLGLLGVAINQICFTVGLNYTTVGHSALIIATGPISILLLAWLQGLEALKLKKVLGMGLAFSGVAVLGAEHGLSLRSGTLLGDLITFAGSFAFALYTVLGKKMAKKYDSISMNAFNYFAGAVLVLPLALHEALHLTRANGWATVAWVGWAALAYMVVFGSLIAYLIYFWLLRHMTASRLGAFAYLHPVLTTLLGITVLGERVTATLVAGGTLVVLGVYLIESGPRED